VDPAPGASASLATDGKYVYYSSGAGGGTLSYTPVGGGAIKTLYSVATGSSNPVTQICVAGGFVAWSDPNNFTIYGARTPL
jgi:hypothetical protein